ncbi:membrane-spanning 4-domains subfamily A member 4D-like [Neoarius graeffei]|uniref:membrane-spanning 4-domains subfamily A member 4D-like n=1 Tax=Neoarius graeffei TaxID=443677 RepID=UPI00298D4819|nr:membrane-spanning 4-domains subfamily A member 4D-like [Neoarius graeffei]XP_060774073.1 membrane-spanning 4-domains subfamily A member 4D-like [Neoarius graeffei]XP_060774074.1 membrane-spanning 4-domains subfamily A member 4D-like [Neoarius graeffei]
MTPVTAPADTQLSQCRVFLKGEPKALGIVQIMIGVMTFLFGIILTTSYLTVMTISGITLWGSLIVISSGSLSVAAVNHSNSCLVKASLVMNVFSALVAGITLILLIIDMIFFMDRCYYSDYNGYPSCNSIRHLRYGIYGVLFVFSLLELIISICTSAFACNTTCCTQTRPRYAPPMNALPMNAQPMNAQPMNAPPMNAQPMHSPPVYSPPMYNPDFYNQQVPHQSSMNTNKNF